MRRDASRSMRANPIARPHPSRRAHARSNLRNFFGTRAPQDEDDQRVQQSLHTNSLSPSRGAFSAPEVCNLASLTPNEGGRSAESRSGAAAPVGRALGASQDARERAYDAARQALARRLASHDAGRSPLGAPPWRFF